MSCYGAILRSPGSDFPPTSPPLSEYELEISDEDSLEHLLSRSVIADVRFALRQAWSVCYPNNDADEAIDIGRGGRAKKMVSDDSRWYPDWAGVQPTQMIPPSLRNALKRPAVGGTSEPADASLERYRCGTPST